MPAGVCFPVTTVLDRHFGREKMKTKQIDVEFSDTMRVVAHMDGVSIATDQSVKEGGGGTAPSPFQLFLASLATCAGVYAKRFCESRKLSTQGMALTVRCDFAEKEFRVENMTYDLTLPEGFPAKYTNAIHRAVDLCAVKKHVCDAPDFQIVCNHKE